MQVCAFLYMFIADRWLLIRYLQLLRINQTKLTLIAFCRHTNWKSEISRTHSRYALVISFMDVLISSNQLNQTMWSDPMAFFFYSLLSHSGKPSLLLFCQDCYTKCACIQEGNSVTKQHYGAGENAQGAPSWRVRLPEITGTWGWVLGKDL